MVESACGATSDPITSGDFRHHLLFHPCLDRMLQELTHCFSDVGEELMSGIQACNPTSPTFLSEDALQNLATHDKIPLKPEELMVARNFIKRKLEKVKGKQVSSVKEKDPDVATVFHMLDEDMFPTLKAVLQVASDNPCEQL